MRAEQLSLLAVLVLGACVGERRGNEVPSRGNALDAPAEDSALTALSALPAVLFLGTSLTAGYGLEESDAYPALIQRKIDSAGLSFRVINAGVSGETSAGGLRRIDWLLRQPVAVLVLELGANDGLRGQDVEAMRANLQGIIDRTRAAHPDARIVIAGMESPPNMGRQYTSAFRAVFPELARVNGATLIPFLLDGVAAVPELNQADGIHPTAEGQRRVAEIVWRFLEPLLRPAGEAGEAGRRAGGPTNR